MTMKHTYAVLAAALAFSFPAIASTAPANDSRAAIRPFHVHVAEAELADLRRRIAQTRWPDKEKVSDRSRGAQLRGNAKDALDVVIASVPGYGFSGKPTGTGWGRIARALAELLKRLAFTRYVAQGDLRRPPTQRSRA